METRGQIETMREIKRFCKNYNRNNSFLRVKCINSTVKYLIRLSDIIEIEKHDDFVAIRTSREVYQIAKEEYDNKISEFISIVV